MSKKYRVGIAGVCHVHVHNVALIFQKHPQVELTACADTPAIVPELTRAPYTRAWNLDYLSRHVGIPRAYADYRQMLEKEKLDIVICNSDNSQHPDIVDACGAVGAHVCIEKPMAASLDAALRMARSAEASGIRVLIHWYLPFSPLMRRAKALLEEGAVGEILEVKMRAAHAGPLAPGVRHPGPNIETVQLTGPELASTWWYQKAAGGGAMVDFCSYGAVVARWFIGEPAVTALGLRANLNSPWCNADDHGVIVARFSRAVGLFEGSWTTVAPGLAGGPIVHGTKATMVVDEWGAEPAVRLFQCGGGASRHDGLPLPMGRQTVAEEFIHCIEADEPFHPTLGTPLNADAMAIIEAGMRSAATGGLEAIQAAGR